MTKLGPFDPNGIYCGDSADMLAQLPDGCIDLTVTSPPYDNLRTYNGFVFDFERTAKQLWRVTKLGGVVVWVVGDGTTDNGESCTSFREILGFVSIGFRLHQTLIYEKTGHPFPPVNKYYQTTEYMFVCSRGVPKSINLLRVPNSYTDKRRTPPLTRQKDGSMERMKYQLGNKDRIRDNVWRYNTGGGHSAKESFAHEHPAIFPEQLAHDHILSWSNPGDIVLDPMCGSGTTLKMAKTLERDYLGFDISQEYVDLSNRRVDGVSMPMNLFRGAE